MVQLMNSGNFRSESNTFRGKFLVKIGIEDSLEEKRGPFNKKAKLPSSFHQQWSGESGGVSIVTYAIQYNPLDEPSPLGLWLRRSPSLMDLIKMRLSQSKGFTLGGSEGDKVELGKKKEVKGSSSASDKLKVFNFPTSLLKIRTLETVSRYEGNLVVKCYYAKHKLVWEVLDGGLKSKMEIQWSDITALKANFPEDGHRTLDLVLVRQSLFFRETNPQPRKHPYGKQLQTLLVGKQAHTGYNTLVELLVDIVLLPMKLPTQVSFTWISMRPLSYKNSQRPSWLIVEAFSHNWKHITSGTT